MNSIYHEQQKKRQVRLFKEGFFGNVQNKGPFKFYKDRKYLRTGYFEMILKPEFSSATFFPGILEGIQQYFEKNNISWWREKEDGYAPTGHLLSSQTHCLNHLFPLRKDSDAVLAMLNGIQNRIHFTEVFPIPCDMEEDAYIAFEFVHKNKSLLAESYESRGKNCTSVDAFAYAGDDSGKKWLIPIEWKYTESYDLNDRVYESSLRRYRPLADNGSNLGGWNSLYEHDPYYEFARQTLLAEQIIKSDDPDMPADDFLHIIVIPDGNTGLLEMAEKFTESLVTPDKVHVVSPEKLLAGPVTLERYHNLNKYLKKRYWDEL